MGEKTVDSCLEVLNNGKSIKEWNHTNIVLIPKVDHPVSVSDYRPISLCNVNYKIVTKTIANRLKLILDKVISNSQSAFVPNRSILDNVIIGHECLHMLRKKVRGNGGFAAVKLDLSKAFDRVEWIFLQELMLKLGFD